MTTPPDIGYDDRDFKVVAIGKAKPDEKVVAKLERLLERAKLGEVRGVIGIVTLLDGCTEHWMEGQSELITILGQLVRLTHRVQAEADSGMTDVDEPGKGG